MAGEKPAELPPGVKLLRTLEGHTAGVDIVAFSPDVRLLALAVPQRVPASLRCGRLITYQLLGILGPPYEIGSGCERASRHPSGRWGSGSGSGPESRTPGGTIGESYAASMSCFLDCSSLGSNARRRLDSTVCPTAS